MWFDIMDFTFPSKVRKWKHNWSSNLDIILNCKLKYNLNWKNKNIVYNLTKFKLNLEKRKE